MHMMPVGNGYGQGFMPIMVMGRGQKIISWAWVWVCISRTCHV